jgi:uncharacterized membrane protein required for colicin V production
MDLLDGFIVILIILGGWNGYHTGMFKQLTRLFGVVIAYALARWLRPYLTPAFERMHLLPEPHGALGLLLGNVDSAVSFGLVFLVAFLLLRYGAGLVDTLFRLPGLSLLNRLAGFIVGVVIVVVLVYVGSLLAHYVPNAMVQHQLKHSVIVRQMDQLSI